MGQTIKSLAKTRVELEIYSFDTVSLLTTVRQLGQLDYSLRLTVVNSSVTTPYICRTLGFIGGGNSNKAHIALEHVLFILHLKSVIS